MAPFFQVHSAPWSLVSVVVECSVSSGRTKLPTRNVLLLKNERSLAGAKWRLILFENRLQTREKQNKITKKIYFLWNENLTETGLYAFKIYKAEKSKFFFRRKLICLICLINSIFRYCKEKMKQNQFRYRQASSCCL